MFNLSSFLPKPYFSSFLVISVDFDHVKAAVFNKRSLHLEGVGTSVVSGDIALAIRNAVESVGAVVSQIPKETIIGLQNKSLYGVENLVEMSRPEPNKKISFEEVDSAVRAQLKSEGGNKLFFSTIATARLDGVKILSPIGVAGSQLHLAVFNSFMASTELAKIDQAITELGVDVVKVLPTSFSIARLTHHRLGQDFLLFFINKNQVEMTRVQKESVKGVSTINVDIEDSNWSEIVGLLLQTNLDKEENYHGVYLWGEDHVDKAKTMLEKLEWEKLDIKPPERFEILSLKKLELETELDLAALSNEIKD